jgi:SAM-dependent methyltransferase
MQSDHEIVRYATHLEFPGWTRAPQFVGAAIEREQAASVLEVGGGRNPTIPPAEVARRGISYAVNDVFESELALADAAYEKLCFDMAEPLPPALAERCFDVIFSRMVNEHVADARAYYENIFQLLNPGGISVHMYATLFALPFVVNRLIPEQLADRILPVVLGGEEPERYEKFPARYSWCRGPTASTIARLRSVGFQVEEFRAYFGHTYYSRVGPLDRCELAKARWLVDHPIPALTSYAAVTMRKPAAAG